MGPASPAREWGKHPWLGLGLVPGTGMGAALENMAVGISLGLILEALPDRRHKDKSTAQHKESEAHE